ncbi:uncharacterized protein LOC129942017 [Eupeodes corollae]|uniref:uncharacterized protein LOC129942017 n=1 Tax=Eupeodes corollae TaxID=290404 RepID=UPI002490E018|nr:uncharacterized protein LOC129942017 [Eupeodes corollae]
MEWISFLSVFLGIISLSSCSLSGPYLMWGHEKLNDLKLPALVEADEQSLSTLFTEAKAVVVFIRNNTNRLDGENYPKFRQLVNENAWTYLPQHTLAVEPFNYNTNVEVINLVGQTSQQDTEIVALFKDSVTIYGEGEVLGILAYREEEVHYMYKREANEETTTQIAPTEEPTETNFIYQAPGKAILYTTTAPLLNMDINGQIHSLALMEHDKEITFDDRNDWSRLNIGFKVNNTRLRLRFNFTLSSYHYWSLTAVEVEYKDIRNSLPLIGDEPVAPLEFSYRCSSKPLIFRSEQDNLTISDYQIQPWLNGRDKFSDAYHCVGFVTVPILSGLFVSAILIGLLFLGILAIMDIKTPNKFETSRSKQLTFTVQE